MNGNNNSPDLMRAIPRKKKASTASLDGPIPRRTATPVEDPSIARQPSSSMNDPIPRRPSTSSVRRERLPSSQDQHPSDSAPRRPSTDTFQARQHSSPAERRPSSATFGTPAGEERRKPPKRIRVKSEEPLIVVVRTAGLSLREGIPKQEEPILEDRALANKLDSSEGKPSRNRMRNGTDNPRVARTISSRVTSQKRPRSIYLEDTDSEEEAAMLETLPPKKPKSNAEPPSQSAATEGVATVAAPAPAIVMSTDAPPPGILSTLWYSNEAFLHVWVLDKVCGFKTRRITSLRNNEPTVLFEHADALSLQARILQARPVWTNAKKRMEVSRINPTHCPVLQVAKAAQDPQNWTFEIMETTEEVFLIKWRGRSHLHCSWERAEDVIRLDSSNNSTARNKIRRYYQQQEAVLGLNWKATMDADRAIIEAAEEYFPADCLEIERILACDENEMSMTVLVQQHEQNSREEQQALETKEIPRAIEENAYRDITKGVSLSDEMPWDPEDNVRYVVKWKGLPFAEMTWEYWRDIKRDAVEEAEDFWYRQKPPVNFVEMPHPHIREFKKLQESPIYGIFTRKRPWEIDRPSEDEDDTSKGFRLRNYQLEGVNWLLFNWWNKRSCILADEMGLGKTIQSTAFLRELQNQPATQIRAPFLVVAPLSLVGQWKSELLSWAPDMNVLLYHGSADARDFLVQQEFYYTDQFVPRAEAVRLKKNHVTKFHVLITTYEVVLKDSHVMSKIKWKALIVDEAHRLKNSKSRLFEQLANVPRDFCLLLTGTPIANATEELWALLHFANPKEFAEKESFLEKFGEMKAAQQVNELHSILKPFLLRRVKEDVEKSLPPKEETILEVSLTPIQKAYYKAIYERNTSFLFKGAKASNAPSLMNVMMELRKCCNHPYLVKGAEERILADAAAKNNDRADAEMQHSQLFGEQLIKSSGKMVLMEKLLQKLFDGGHKVLVFSQMVRVLDLLEELLKLKKYRYERLDGSTSSSSRASAVDRFTKKSCQRFVMLLSTRAGGLGLNLTAADIVIIFDSDWNPQNDLQAMARAHRIGQTRAVRVYRLLTAKTYEMHMFHSASLKLGLERAVLSQNREQNDEVDTSKKKGDKEAQARQIDELLKKGAYDVFRDDDDTEAEKFMETNIDQLLEHSSKTVTYGSSATSSLGSGLGSFSKASFVANTDDGTKDVDLDDPDFWSKAVGFEAQDEIPEDVAQMLDDGVKRSRRQVQVYDPYAETAEAEQRKKERLELEKMLEKEEKDRVRVEKKAKKKDAKDKKRRDIEQEIEEQSQGNLSEKPKSMQPKVAERLASKNVKEPREPRPKKPKKNDRVRALRRAENEDPMLERLRQAWEVPHRNRAVASIIRFGFGRFCKIRSESNLANLPLQDLEVFFRAYIYQLGLQAAVTVSVIVSENQDVDARKGLKDWLGASNHHEVEWISQSVRTAIQKQVEVEQRLCDLRMPFILVEPSYAEELRKGAALRSLRRIGLLSRLNRFMDDCLESVLGALGHEALGKRGCVSSDLSSLDPDLKARYVTTEELSLVIGWYYKMLDFKSPASWWDRSCDIGLIIGSFVHGLGNYEAMRHDADLPFCERILRSERHDHCAVKASKLFRVATEAARKVFDDALEANRVKAELEVQAAVAAAAKAASKREEDAAVLRKGGAEAAAVMSEMPDTQVEDAFAFDGTDSHFVTLPRLMKHIHESVGAQPKLAIHSGEGAIPARPDMPESSKGIASAQEDGMSRSKEEDILQMPDARVLDFRFRLIMDALESQAYPDEVRDDSDVNEAGLWRTSDEVEQIIKIRNNDFGKFVIDSTRVAPEYSGIGIGLNQCGASHRTLNDGSDFGYGSASVQLSNVAYGTDSPRYLRAMGVPMNLTRHAVSGLVHARESCAKELLRRESLRFYGVDKANGNSVSKKSQSSGLDGEVEPDAKLAGIDPNSHMSPEFLSSPQLRATVCLAVIFYGFPDQDVHGKNVNADVLTEVEGHIGTSDNLRGSEVFTQEKFRDLVVQQLPGVAVPDAAAFATYVEKFLLPHCLQLCIYGNGPFTTNARGSHGDYTTALGVNLHPEPSEPLQTPLPDPCVSLQQHSLEALGNATAILRRVRLFRACAYSCSSHIANAIKKVINTEDMGYLEGWPVWWCPWVHDTALLLQAATGGLLSVLNVRHEHPIFSPQAVEELLRQQHSSRDPLHISQWASAMSLQFPSLYELERRLAHLCSLLTAESPEHVRYNNLPMFDHGAWPR